MSSQSPASVAKTHAEHRRLFYLRFARASVFAAGLLVVSLGLGVLGYHFIAELTWVDSLLNASMILTSMGPVDVMQTDGAKVFASCYAMFSGMIFISATGILLAPVFHRVLHKFHIEQGNKE